jgi:hypothetical protein
VGGDGQKPTQPDNTMKLFRILFDESPVEGGNGNPPPPPVASTVLNGTISEQSANLQQKIDELIAERDTARVERDGEKGRAKKLETDIATLQDKLAALQNPPPAHARDDRSELEKFMAGE